MFTKLTFPFRPWLILFVIPFLLFACASDTEPKVPLPNGIPKNDIVFMPNDPVNPGYANTVRPTLGFINDDGTESVVYSFLIFGGSLSNFGEKLGTNRAEYPRWSKSGDMLVFEIRGNLPNTRLIDFQGRMYGKNCDAFVGGDFDAKGNILGGITKASPFYSEYQNKVTANASLVARYDIKNCTLVDVFSVPIPQDSFTSGINEAENSLVTAGLYKSNTNTNKVMIFDPMIQSLTSFPGYDPSLSNDGTWLAYYSTVGDLIVRNIKSGVEKSIINVIPSDDVINENDYFSMPGWSPDNKWLVYNTLEGKIYKVNIETGENVYITDGWAPDWRP